ESAKLQRFSPTNCLQMQQTVDRNGKQVGNLKLGFDKIIFAVQICLNADSFVFYSRQWWAVYTCISWFFATKEGKKFEKTPYNKCFFIFFLIKYFIFFFFF
ncbi:hypothetical protein, partial [Escherichia coli]|uniref:hypothetical protein n=1 Tax=Escherichia coli TaxID=562 RepID=UPI001BAF65AF